MSPGAPRAELFRALAVLAEPPGDDHGAVVRALELGAVPDAAAYTELFLFQLYPYASVHLGAEGMLGGEARGRVAGFWRAVGRPPPAEPDHLAALLALYASLLEEEARAGDGPEGAMVTQGRRALLHEHLAPWAPAFLERVVELDGGAYAAWAAVTSSALDEELEAVGPAAELPLHLRKAPPLPDPRQEGGEGFLDVLLAPVRSGMILARADLARLARSLELGLRMGERRYILEQLLGQDPPRVLKALSEEAGRWAERHGKRRGALGVTGDFWVERAERACELLAELAWEGAGAITDAAAPDDRGPEDAAPLEATS